jgi:hypothetical protein
VDGRAGRFHGYEVRTGVAERLERTTGGVSPDLSAQPPRVETDRVDARRDEDVGVRVPLDDVDCVEGVAGVEEADRGSPEHNSTLNRIKVAVHPGNHTAATIGGRRMTGNGPQERGGQNGPRDEDRAAR